MRKFLSWFQEHIKSWIKPATPALIIDLLSDLTQSYRFNCRKYVVTPVLATYSSARIYVVKQQP